MREVADILEEMPDAFLPEVLRGQLVEAEHFARYWWLAQTVAGRRVLDAGCGVAHGARLLAEAGAKEVVGIDSSTTLLEAALTEYPGVRLEQGDVCALGFENESFEVVAAFGLLDQVRDPERALFELLRVLTPDGLIVVSVPPAAKHDPMEGGEGKERGQMWGTIPMAKTIEATLAQSCRHHVVLHQRNWMTSAILDEATSSASDGELLDALEVRKVAAPGPRSEVVTLIMGNRGNEPRMRGTAVISTEFAQRRWLERSVALERKLADRANLARELQDALRERKILAERLLELEHESPSRLVE